jgi:hypothetical protein
LRFIFTGIWAKMPPLLRHATATRNKKPNAGDPVALTDTETDDFKLS